MFGGVKLAKVSLFKTIIFGKCPACGKTPIYEGLLFLKDNCKQCGFSLKDRDTGDGPVFFVIVIVGALVTTMAVFVDIVYNPALILHFVIWPVFTFVAVIMLLRIAKSVLILMHSRFVDKKKDDKK